MFVLCRKFRTQGNFPTLGALLDIVAGLGPGSDSHYAEALSGGLGPSLNEQWIGTKASHPKYDRELLDVHTYVCMDYTKNFGKWLLLKAAKDVGGYVTNHPSLQT